MKKFPFILNGEDFTDLTNKYGYITDRVPVYSSQWTDLSGVKHRNFFCSSVNQCLFFRGMQSK